MDEKSKTKNVKRLPMMIQFSVISSYFLLSILNSFSLWLFLELGFTIEQSVLQLILIVPPPIFGFFIGWLLKFRYVSKHGDDQDQLRNKAQFWGAMAFLVAFVVSLLLILILLIILESRDFLPQNLASPFAFILSMFILGISLLIANNARKRIYRNFGYS